MGLPALSGRLRPERPPPRAAYTGSVREDLHASRAGAGRGRALTSAVVTVRRLVLALVLGLSLGSACKGKPSAGPEPGAAQSAMGSWDAWLTLAPLVEVARSHAPAPAVAALEKASALLKDGKAKSADAALAELADSEGRHWIAVARADLASIYFTVCIRGVAWRLVDLDKKAPPSRRSDYSQELRLGPGDVSVEGMLTNLDAALTAKDPTLVTQARIARARATAYVSRCPANKDVADMATGLLKGDLATLAAENHLTPDLAYLWAGVQMSEYSGSAAKPFLLLAREGGYQDPAILTMLAVIALEQRDLAVADKHAQEAEAAYKQLGDVPQQAQAVFLRGEAARAKGDKTAARAHYEAARKLDPAHAPALFGIAKLVLDADGQSAAIKVLQAAFPGVLREGPLTGEKLEDVIDNLEAFVSLPQEADLISVSRDALLAEVELEKDLMRRGLRYFFAATLDARLGEYDHARAHAVLARDEFADHNLPPPLDIQAFLDRLDRVQ